jgi:hypothetical protein
MDVIHHESKLALGGYSTARGSFDRGKKKSFKLKAPFIVQKSSSP